MVAHQNFTCPTCGNLLFTYRDEVTKQLVGYCLLCNENWMKAKITQAKESWIKIEHTWEQVNKMNGQ